MGQRWVLASLATHRRSFVATWYEVEAEGHGAAKAPCSSPPQRTMAARDWMPTRVQTPRRRNAVSRVRDVVHPSPRTDAVVFPPFSSSISWVGCWEEKCY